MFTTSSYVTCPRIDFLTRAEARKCISVVCGGAERSRLFSETVIPHKFSVGRFEQANPKGTVGRSSLDMRNSKIGRKENSLADRRDDGPRKPDA